MDESARFEPIPLRTILFTLSVPDATLATLRADFPEIRFVVADEEAGPDGDTLRDAEAVIGWNLGPETLAAPRLRWFHNAGAGVDRFDLAAIAARGLIMTNGSGVSAPNMAEHALGMMIALTRRFPQLMRAQLRHEWRDHETHREVGELQEQTLLIIGTGDIGQELARRAAAFGLRILGVRRRDGSPLPGFDAIFTVDRLATALAEADHVVVTVPETPRTRRLIDAAAFAAMKPGAMIYNVGRGGVIDPEALIAALDSGHLAGAGLDVTDPEPLPAASPLWDMPNVLITAHTSGATPRFWDRAGPLIADNIRRIRSGEPPHNLVDLREGY